MAFTLNRTSGPRAASRISAAVSAVAGVVVAALKGAVAPHKASLANLRAIPLTVAGVFCVDFAGFHLAHGWGWLITGASLIILEHIIADDA